MKLTEDHAPVVAVLALTLLSYMIVNFTKVTAFAIVVILFSVQSKHNKHTRKSKVIAARQSEESSDKKKDDGKSDENDSKDSLSTKQAKKPGTGAPEMTKNADRIKNIGSGTMSMKAVEQRTNELLFANMHRFKTFPHPPQNVLNNELHFAFVDLDNRGSKKDIYMSLEGDDEDDANCNRFSKDE